MKDAAYFLVAAAPAASAPARRIIPNDPYFKY
jgi:hypothetical protein